MKKVFIIILNYNQKECTIECLESIFRQNYSNYQVIVVDNNSQDQSLDYFENWAKRRKTASAYELYEIESTKQAFKKIKCFNNESPIRKTSNSIIFIKSKENLGYAKGNNIGIKFIRKHHHFDYIWILNNDTVVSPDALKKMINGHNKNNIGLLGSTLVYYDPPHQVQSYGGKLNKFLGTVKSIKSIEQIPQIDYISGASLLITKECLLKIGELPKEYFMYYEDLDYSLIAKKNGFELKVVPDALVYHKEGGTSGSNSRNKNKQNEQMDLTSLESRWIFTRKYNFPVTGIYLGFLFSIINRIRRRQYFRALKVILFILKKTPKIPIIYIS